MGHIIDFFFEAQMLKRIKRTGYQFLGVGAETVAEHTFITSIIAWVMSQMEPMAKEKHLILMCLMHDIPEARTGDLNYVQKQYVKNDEKNAIHDSLAKLPFGSKIKSLLNEFNEKQTLEAKLANDADQLAFVIDLKYLADSGHPHTLKWVKTIKSRLTTSVGQKILKEILSTKSSSWWKKIFIDKNKY